MESIGTFLPLIAMMPFVGALFPGLMIQAGRNVCAVTAAIPTMLAITMLAICAPAVLDGAVHQPRERGARRPARGAAARCSLQGATDSAPLHRSLRRDRSNTARREDGTEEQTANTCMSSQLRRL